MKQFFLAIALIVASASASAGIYGIVGGIGVRVGTAEPIVINLDGREIFLSELDCTTALDNLLKAKVTQATSNNAGVFTGADPTKFNAVQVTKINMATCIKTVQ
jgi:hypothetical protein